MKQSKKIHSFCIFLLTFFSFCLVLETTDIYALRSVREGAYLVFYNSKNLKVKAYFYPKNKAIFLYRYYYNPKNQLIRKEKWKKTQLISWHKYRYNNQARIQRKQFWQNGKLQWEILYSKEGRTIYKKYQ